MVEQEEMMGTAVEIPPQRTEGYHGSCNTEQAEAVRLNKTVVITRVWRVVGWAEEEEGQGMTEKELYTRKHINSNALARRSRWY